MCKQLSYIVIYDFMNFISNTKVKLNSKKMMQTKCNHVVAFYSPVPNLIAFKFQPCIQLISFPFSTNPNTKSLTWLYTTNTAVLHRSTALVSRSKVNGFDILWINNQWVVRPRQYRQGKHRPSTAIYQGEKVSSIFRVAGVCRRQTTTIQTTFTVFYKRKRIPRSEM